MLSAPNLGSYGYPHRCRYRSRYRSRCRYRHRYTGTGPVPVAQVAQVAQVAVRHTVIASGPCSLGDPEQRLPLGVEPRGAACRGQHDCDSGRGCPPVREVRLSRASSDHSHSVFRHQPSGVHVRRAPCVCAVCKRRVAYLLTVRGPRRQALSCHVGTPYVLVTSSLRGFFACVCDMCNTTVPPPAASLAV